MAFLSPKDVLYLEHSFNPIPTRFCYVKVEIGLKGYHNIHYECNMATTSAILPFCEPPEPP